MDLEQEAPLEERVGQIEIELQRALEEVEACSVLVLSLDGGIGTASGSGGRRLETDSEETLRLKARIDVLEEAWALRSTTVGQRAEESIARVEEEVKKIWRELLSKERNPSKESGHVEARLLEDLKQRLEKTQSQVAELNALKPEDVDTLMKKMIDEVGHSVKLLGDRCSKLEVELATMQATDVSSQADRERTEQLEKMVDLLLQQRRQDLQESQANFREVEARFLDLDQRDHAEKSWRQEAEAIRKEIQEVRSTHVPSLFQQHMKAMKAMQEGLAAVRAEVKKLSEVVEAVQASSSTPRAEAQANGSSREVLALKAQVSDLQEQVTLLVVRGLEERFANLRADVSREVTAAVRETKENWAVASRRLSALEAWPASQAELSAEMQSMRSEWQEDRGRLELLSREAEGLGRQVVHIRRELSLGPRPEETAEEPPAPTEASSGGGLLEGLFSETPKTAKGTIRSAAKMASMATSRSPRTQRKRSEENRRSNDGQVLQQEQSTSRSITPRGGPGRGSRSSITTPGLPVVIGPKLEWALTAKALQAGRQAPGNNGVLITGELEVAGIFCRLKFFPDGSPLRHTEGSCSLYLMCTVPNVNVRFRLFAGTKYSPVLEANTARGGRDQGRHDLCLLGDVLNEDGSVVVGAEILEVRNL